MDRQPVYYRNQAVRWRVNWKRFFSYIPGRCAYVVDASSVISSNPPPLQKSR